jgi:hypothetical protein
MTCCVAIAFPPPPYFAQVCEKEGSRKYLDLGNKKKHFRTGYYV